MMRRIPTWSKASTRLRNRSGECSWRGAAVAITSILAGGLLVASVQAEVTFDGSIGAVAPGTVRSGNFVVGEPDGQLSGNNLFHSFRTLNVNPGETATFSHTTDGVQNIIGRVTGDTSTQIRGGVAVRQDVGGFQVPTSAVLWVMNPSGVFIGDGAFFDPNSSFRLSTANQLDFDNGDGFFTHDVTQSSTLSIGNPTKFGFLADDTLPPTVTPNGIEIRIDDPGNSNAPLFLADMTLVGTSTVANRPGVTVQGDIPGGLDTTGVFAPLDSSQIQAFRLGLYALGAGKRIDVVTPPDFSKQTGNSGIRIRDSNILVTDNGLPISSQFRAGAGTIEIDRSFLQAGAIAAPAQVNISAQTIAVDGSQVSSVGLTAVGPPGDVALASGSGGLSLTDSTVRNLSLSTGAGGDVLISADGNIVIGANAGSQFIQTNTAGSQASGDIRITAGGDLAVTGPYQLTSNTTSAGNAGAIVLTGENVSLDGGSGRVDVSSSTGGTGKAGQIELTAQGGGLALSATDLSTVGLNGAAGNIRLVGVDVALDDAGLSTATVSNNAADDPATIDIQAAQSLRVQGGLILSSTAAAAPAGQIQIASDGSVSLSQVNIQSASTADGLAGDISVSAASELTLQGQDALVLTNAEGSSDAGNVLLQAANIEVLDRATIQTTSTGSGDAGNIRLQGGRIYTDSGRIESASANAGGGNIELYGRDVILDGNAETQNIVAIIASSFSSDDDGNGGSITLGDPLDPAELVVVRSSGLTASAQQGDGGRININSLNFIRDATSLFLVTSESGEPGALEINAPERNISAAIVELDVPRLDQTELIQDVCASAAGERSSLIVVPIGDVEHAPDRYFPSTSPDASAVDERGSGLNDLRTGHQTYLAWAPADCLR